MTNELRIERGVVIDSQGTVIGVVKRSDHHHLCMSLRHKRRPYHYDCWRRSATMKALAAGLLVVLLSVMSYGGIAVEPSIPAPFEFGATTQPGVFDPPQAQYVIRNDGPTWLWMVPTYDEAILTVTPPKFWIAPGASRTVWLAPRAPFPFTQGKWVGAITWKGQPRIVGDIDGDGQVNLADMKLFMKSWGTADAAADFDGDGVVSLADLKFIQGNMGKAFAPASQATATQASKP